MNKLAITALVLVLGAGPIGCAHQQDPAGTVRFVNREPVKVVNDRVHTPDMPEENPFPKNLYHFDGFVHKNLTRRMEMRGDVRAANVNSLDEVPNSTWFTNRIGVRDMSVQEIKRGPGDGTGNPEAYKPWKIVSSKVGGASIGFIIEDARGERYLLKFDKKGFPETDTAADVILARLLYAVGYNVPEDYIVEFKRDEVELAKDAVVKDPFGNKSPLTGKILDQQLAKINIQEDGTIRALVSKFIEGKPLGGTIRDGVREDDPNDTLPHYLRREIRGQYPIFAWLDHADIKEDNTLDVYVEDPGNPEIKYVKHYLLDFGNALGVQGHINNLKFVGYSHTMDFEQMAQSLFSLGIWERPWEDRSWPRLRGIGLFSADTYHPGEWKSYTPSYFPFHDTDEFDAFWGAKIIARFTPAQIRAAVEEARYSDPDATEYMVKTLVERQRKTARYWFEQVNPLDRFEVNPSGEAHQVCFDDLMIVYNLDYVKRTTTYDVVGYDYQGNPTGFEARGLRPDPGSGRACIDDVPASTSRDGYTILSIDTLREDRDDLEPVLLHLARNAQGRMRVIGIRRQ